MYKGLPCFEASTFPAPAASRAVLRLVLSVLFLAVSLALASDRPRPVWNKATRSAWLMSVSSWRFTEFDEDPETKILFGADEMAQAHVYEFFKTLQHTWERGFFVRQICSTFILSN